jgi:hypothetical protein
MATNVETMPIEEVVRDVQLRFPRIEVEFASSMRFEEKKFFKDLFCEGTTTSRNLHITYPPSPKP